MYKSPIEIFQTEIDMQMEGEILKSIQRVGVSVDKEELLKALKYDRDQYSKGYEEAKRESRWIPVTDHLPQEEGWYQCSCYDPKAFSDGLVRDLYFYPGIKEFVDNIRYFCNGLKDIEKYYWTKYVVAWKPLPEPYKVKRDCSEKRY